MDLVRFVCKIPVTARPGAQRSFLTPFRLGLGMWEPSVCVCVCLNAKHVTLMATRQNKAPTEIFLRCSVWRYTFETRHKTMKTLDLAFETINQCTFVFFWTCCFWLLLLMWCMMISVVYQMYTYVSRWRSYTANGAMIFWWRWKWITCTNAFGYVDGGRFQFKI